MRKPIQYEPLKNTDERETFVKEFAKGDIKNENNKKFRK